MRWLGVDVGLARTGIAISDPDARLAVPLEVAPAQVAFPAIRAIVQREGVAGVVVGLPLTMAGDEGEAARMARRLGDRIERVLAIPVEYEDERLTSSEAEQLTRASGRGDRPSDDLAAVLILQQFLDRRSDEQRRERRHEPE